MASGFKNYHNRSFLVGEAIQAYHPKDPDYQLFPVVRVQLSIT